MKRIIALMVVHVALAWTAGCATQKESHTARTGVEQLLISSAVDRSLDSIDYTPLRDKQVFLETKYLDCVDKNYIIVALRQRIFNQRGKLLDKADQADIVVEVGSGGVGTDGQELFVGIPEIPLAPPSPIAIPRLSVMTRTRMNGTAKLLVIAYDAKSKAPVLGSGTTLARSDQCNWNVLGMGPMQTGTVTREIAAATLEIGRNTTSPEQVVNVQRPAPQRRLLIPRPANPVLLTDHKTQAKPRLEQVQGAVPGVGPVLPVTMPRETVPASYKVESTGPSPFELPPADNRAAPPRGSVSNARPAVTVTLREAQKEEE